MIIKLVYSVQWTRTEGTAPVPFAVVDPCVSLPC